MDVAGFLDGLDDIFDGPPQTARPLDPRHAVLCEDVEGMTTPNEVAVLNRAARFLPPEESYLEVGTYRGRSICGAVAGVEGRTFRAIENFAEFGMLGEDARCALMRNLARHAGGKDVVLLEGDAFRLMARGEVGSKPVGVYFYDGEHTTLSHYLALGVAEPFLADDALVLVDDASWPLVQRAHRRFFARHEGWSVERRFDAVVQDDPHWANGLHVLRYQRPPGAPRAMTCEVRTLLLAQRYGVGPARRAVWRTLHRFPGLVPIAKRLNPTRSSTVEG